MCKNIYIRKERGPFDKTYEGHMAIPPDYNDTVFVD
jgi:hypothetical protein